MMKNLENRISILKREWKGIALSGLLASLAVLVFISFIGSLISEISILEVFTTLLILAIGPSWVLCVSVSLFEILILRARINNIKNRIIIWMVIMLIVSLIVWAANFFCCGSSYFSSNQDVFVIYPGVILLMTLNYYFLKVSLEGSAR